MRKRRWRWVAPLCAALVFAVALAARWRWAATWDGPTFQPQPDALEYAASAQALAQSGKFYLQVGPVPARPHYAPGWPLLIAAALVVGVPPQQLWRLTGLCGAVLAVVLAAAARRSVLVLAGERAAPESAAWGALAGGLVAGIGWALAPAAVAVGTTLLSDEPATLAAWSSVLLLAGGMLRSVSPLGRRGLWLWAGASGVAGGLAASMRPIEGALLVAAELPLIIYAGLTLGLRGVLRLLGAWCAGAALPAVLTAAILVHSGLPALAWTGYRFWSLPGARFFDSTFAVAGNPDLPAALDGRVRPHLELAALALFGLPGLPWDWYLGRLWPLLGWLATPWLWALSSAGQAGTSTQPPLCGNSLPQLRRLAGSRSSSVAERHSPEGCRHIYHCRQPLVLCGRAAFPGGLSRQVAPGRSRPGAPDRSREPRRAAIDLLRWVAVGLGCWTLCRVALLSCYFYPAGRFYLPAQAVPLLLLATASGFAAAGGGRWLRRAGCAAAAGLLAALLLDFASFRRGIAPGDPPGRVFKRFRRWIELTDQQRAAQGVPFDPLAAQALGLMDPETVAGIREWGELPPTYHVLRLRKKGLLPPD
ncbi:MAG TPA: hypothetical protein VHR45_04110 [Thermoanaerobaculia bacterium]|nr:hypothetical protein [Thermoanaerobaculia bacterium]